MLQIWLTSNGCDAFARGIHSDGRNLHHRETVKVRFADEFRPGPHVIRQFYSASVSPLGYSWIRVRWKKIWLTQVTSDKECVKPSVGCYRPATAFCLLADLLDHFGEALEEALLIAFAESATHVQQGGNHEKNPMLLHSSSTANLWWAHLQLLNLKF